MQTQKVDKKSEGYQAGRDLIIQNGPSLEEIAELMTRLIEVNNPLIIEQAKAEAKKYAEEFIKDFLEGLESESDKNAIKESFKKSSSQYLLDEGIKNAQKYGATCDLKLLAKAVRQTMLENDDEKAQLSMSVSEIIPKLYKQQLLIISIMWFVQVIMITGDDLQRDPAETLEYWANLLVLLPEIEEISKASIYHFITLGVCTFNQFSGGSAEATFGERYKGIFKERVLPLFKNNPSQVTTLKRICEIYDKNNLNQFHITPVGTCIGYLIATSRGVSLPERLYGAY